MKPRYDPGNGMRCKGSEVGNEKGGKSERWPRTTNITSHYSTAQQTNGMRIVIVIVIVMVGGVSATWIVRHSCHVCVCAGALSTVHR